jgi:hypothetical protein
MIEQPTQGDDSIDTPNSNLTMRIIASRRSKPDEVLEFPLDLEFVDLYDGFVALTDEQLKWLRGKLQWDANQ